VFQVDGDNCAPAEPAVPAEVDVEVDVELVSENEFAGTNPVWPVVFDDDDDDEASDDNRSIADEAAPMAKNMTQNPQRTEEIGNPVRY